MEMVDHGFKDLVLQINLLKNADFTRLDNNLRY